MHAFLVTGATKSRRLQYIDDELGKLRVAVFDRTLLQLSDRPSLGIADIRNLEQRLHLSPTASRFTAAVIHDCHALTREAQQALLKLLEEPPAFAKIFLETDNAETLLPTVLSRCQTVSLGFAEKFTPDILAGHLSALGELFQKSPAERMIAVEAETKTREDALLWTEKSIAAVRTSLFTEKFFSRKSGAELLRKLARCRAQLSANVTTRLCIDHVVLGEK